MTGQGRANKNAWIIRWPPGNFSSRPQPSYCCEEHKTRYWHRLVAWASPLPEDDPKREENCRYCWTEGRD